MRQGRSRESEVYKKQRDVKGRERRIERTGDDGGNKRMGRKVRERKRGDTMKEGIERGRKEGYKSRMREKIMKEKGESENEMINR